MNAIARQLAAEFQSRGRVIRYQRRDLLPGGIADKASVSQFDRDQLAKGLKVEMEHTSDPAVALEIAMDHLSEDPRYYDKLGVMRLSRMLSAEFARRQPFRYRKEFVESEHPRKEDGEFTKKEEGRAKRPKRTPGKTVQPPRQKKDSVKSARAKAAYNPATKAKQDASEALEHKVAKALGATKSGDNLPMDVTLHNEMVGLEIKMIHDGKDDKVHMRKDSRKRKEAWIAAKKGRRAFTVIIDNRDKFENGQHKSKYSGNRIYWREGVGAFRFKGMNTATSLDDLKRQLGV